MLRGYMGGQTPRLEACSDMHGRVAAQGPTLVRGGSAQLAYAARAGI